MKEPWEKECAALRAEVAALRKQLQALEPKQTGANVGVANPLSRWRLSKRVMVVLLPVVVLVAAGGVRYGQGAIDALFIDKDGNVGIGTSAPEQVVDIRSNGEKSPFAIDNALFLGSLNGTARVTNNAYIDENGTWQIKDTQKKAFTLEIRDSGQLELYGTVTNGKADWRKVATFDAANNKIGFGAPLSVNGVSLQNALVPVGTIMAYGGDTSKAEVVEQLLTQGWLPCDGRAVKRADYSELFQATATAFGAGDAQTTFQVPDLRGRFLRGTDQGQGRDPDAASRRAEPAGGNSGDSIGSVQDDDFKEHRHGYYVRTNLRNQNQMTAAGGQDLWLNNGNTQPAGGRETRPKNVYVNWIIKAKHT